MIQKGLTRGIRQGGLVRRDERRHIENSHKHEQRHQHSNQPCHQPRSLHDRGSSYVSTGAVGFGPSVLMLK